MERNELELSDGLPSSIGRGALEGGTFEIAAFDIGALEIGSLQAGALEILGRFGIRGGVHDALVDGATFFPFETQAFGFLGLFTCDL